MTKKHTNNVIISRTVRDVVDKMLAPLLNDYKKLAPVPLHSVSQNNRARLRNLKKEFRKFSKECKHLFADIRRDYKEYQKPPKPRVIKYTGDEPSFQQFRSTKVQYTVAEYIQRMRIEGDDASAYYKEVEAVLGYDEGEYIFIIKDGKMWTYDPFYATKKKYVYFLGEHKLAQSNDLEKVERAMFTHYLKD